MLILLLVLTQKSFGNYEKAGLKAIPTGIDHGTVTVVADQQSYEITTFRGY